MRVAAALALVAVGGAAGTFLRALVSEVLPGHGLAATLAVNVVGAFLLGLLLEALALSGARGYEGRPGAARLLLGTGFCGGFTTYSAVAYQGALLLGDGEAPLALAYAVLTLVLGALATICGVVLGTRLGAWRAGVGGTDPETGSEP